MAGEVRPLHLALLDRAMALRQKKQLARALGDDVAEAALGERLSKAIRDYFVAECRHIAAERDAAGLDVEEWMWSPLARTDEELGRQS